MSVGSQVARQVVLPACRSADSPQHETADCAALLTPHTSTQRSAVEIQSHVPEQQLMLPQQRLYTCSPCGCSVSKQWSMPFMQAYWQCYCRLLRGAAEQDGHLQHNKSTCTCHEDAGLTLMTPETINGQRAGLSALAPPR